MSTHVGYSGGLANWRLLSGRRSTDRLRSEDGSRSVSTGASPGIIGPEMPIGRAFPPGFFRRWSVLARMACQQPRRPQLVRIAVLLGLVARQRHQPSLGLRRDRRLLARSRTVIECRQWAVGHRPLDAALDRLMMDTKSPPHRKER